jgi:membrane protein required for colicin V production
MNSFDAVIYVLVIVAVIAGFRSGLLRSVATILGYLAAAPIALVSAPRLVPVLADLFQMPFQTWVVFCGLFLVTGFVLGTLLRSAVSAIVGPTVSLPDRAAGSVLGAVRIVLLAVLMVLIFDRIIPTNRQPPFLADSRLRPILSMAGVQGLKSLPPDVADYIDQLKRARGI